MKVIFAPAVSIVVGTTLQRYDGRYCRAPIPLVNVGTSDRKLVRSVKLKAMFFKFDDHSPTPPQLLRTTSCAYTWP